MGFSYVWRGRVCVAIWRLSQSISHHPPASVPLWNTAASSELARGLAHTHFHTHILTFTFTPWNAHTLKISMLPGFFLQQQQAGFICVSPLFLKALEFEHQSSAQLPRSPTIPLHLQTVGHLWTDSSVKKLGFQTKLSGTALWQIQKSQITWEIWDSFLHLHLEVN